MTMSIQTLIDQVAELGLGSEEAQAYVHLNILGRCGATDLAASTSLPRTTVYRALQTLVDRGFVTTTLGKPIHFEARAPSAVFESLLAADSADLVKLQESQREVCAALATLRCAPAPALPGSTFRLIRGRNEIFETIADISDRARARLDFFWTFPAATSAWFASDAARRAHDIARSGFPIRVIRLPIVRPTEESRGIPHTVQVRFVETATSALFLVRDEEEVLALAQADVSNRLLAEDDIAILTRAPLFVEAYRTLFDQQWSVGRQVWPPRGGVG